MSSLSTSDSARMSVLSEVDHLEYVFHRIHLQEYCIISRPGLSMKITYRDWKQCTCYSQDFEGCQGSQQQLASSMVSTIEAEH